MREYNANKVSRSFQGRVQMVLRANNIEKLEFWK